MSTIWAFPIGIRTDYGSLGGVLHYGFIDPTRRTRGRPPSAQLHHQQKPNTASVKDGARLQARLWTGAVKVPARRKREDSGRCSFLYEAMRKMAAPATGSRERGGAKPLGPALSGERVLESYGLLESVFDFLVLFNFYCIGIF